MGGAVSRRRPTAVAPEATPVNNAVVAAPAPREPETPKERQAAADSQNSSSSSSNSNSSSSNNSSNNNSSVNSNSSTTVLAAATSSAATSPVTDLVVPMTEGAAEPGAAEPATAVAEDDGQRTTTTTTTTLSSPPSAAPAPAPAPAPDTRTRDRVEVAPIILSTPAAPEETPLLPFSLDSPREEEKPAPMIAAAPAATPLPETPAMKESLGRGEQDADTSVIEVLNFSQSFTQSPESATPTPASGGRSTTAPSTGAPDDDDDDDNEDWDAPIVAPAAAIVNEAADDDDDWDAPPGGGEATTSKEVPAAPVAAPAKKEVPSVAETPAPPGQQPDTQFAGMSGKLAVGGAEWDGCLPALSCSSCGFDVLRFRGCQWSDTADYMHFRNFNGHSLNLPRLTEKLVVDADAAAYACQCTWQSVVKRRDLNQWGTDPGSFGGAANGTVRWTKRKK